MADPAPYEVGYSFANYQSNNPADPLPGAALDNELAGASEAIDELVTAVKDVRRSDGALKNGIVTLDALSVGMLAALGNIDEEAAAAIDAAIDLVQSDLEADLAAGLATKADIDHTHAAEDIVTSPISGLNGATVQAVLAELRLLAPQTGDFILSMNPTTRSGFVACNDGTIGDLTSGGTTRANSDTMNFFVLLWNSVSNTYAPVSTGRGVSAQADYAAHKTIGLTKMLGRALAIAGAGSGLTARTLGQTFGAETHTLTRLELPEVTLDTAIAAGQGAHVHNINGSLNAAGTTPDTRSLQAAGTSDVSSDSATLPAMVGTTPLGGSDDAHNNMQPTSFVHAFLKL